VYFEYICWKFAGRLLDRVNTLLLADGGRYLLTENKTDGERLKTDNF